MFWPVSTSPDPISEKKTDVLNVVLTRLVTVPRLGAVVLPFHRDRICGITVL